MRKSHLVKADVTATALGRALSNGCPVATLPLAISSAPYYSWDGCMMGFFRGRAGHQGEERKDEAAGARLVGVWAKDMSFELDRMEKLDAEKGGPFHGRLDAERVEMFGHSLRVATALKACASDKSCRTVVNLDGTPYGAGSLLRNCSP